MKKDVYKRQEQQPAVTPAPEKPKGEPIDDEGNAYTRDLLYDKTTNKQFLTVQTKNGNTFFIVIDYDAPINEDEDCLLYTSRCV